MATTATYETRRIVVADGLGVTERLEQRIGLEDDVLDAHDLGIVARHGCNVLHHALGGLGLAGATLTTTDDDNTDDDDDNNVTNRSVVRRVEASERASWRRCASLLRRLRRR